MPSTIGDVALGDTWSVSSSAAPAALSSAPTFAAGRCTVRTAPPSLIWTVLALTTGSAIPARGTRLAREAAAGAVSVIASWASASSTVDAVVHTCFVPWPSREICSGRPRRRTMLVASCTWMSPAGYRSSRSPTVKPFSWTMSITRDFMVVTRIATPSTVNVTVLQAVTASPPANASTRRSPATTNRNIGDGV